MDKSTEERIGIVESEVLALKDSDARQWLAIEKLLNRPPVWATTVMSLLTFLIGCILTYAIMLATR